MNKADFDASIRELVPARWIPEGDKQRLSQVFGREIAREGGGGEKRDRYFNFIIVPKKIKIEPRLFTGLFGCFLADTAHAWSLSSLNVSCLGLVLTASGRLFPLQELHTRF